MTHSDLNNIDLFISLIINFPWEKILNSILSFNLSIPIGVKTVF